MNILIFNWKDIKNPDVGGAEIILYELSKRLVGEGHRVTWFCRKFNGSSATEVIDGINIIRQGNKYTVYLKALFYYLSLVNKPDRVLDCINTICWQTPFYIDKRRRFAYVNQLAREVLFYELPPPLSWICYLLESWQYLSYRHTNFLCYAESVKNDLASFGISKKKISVFSLGLDHARYFPAGKSVTPLFSFVARLGRMKRADLCIKAMKKVAEFYPTAQLAIIGFGPEEDNLKRLVEKEGLQTNVFFVNKNNLFFEKNNSDMKVKLLQKSWGLLLPSVKEGWGMVVTEAAACRTPAIVSDVTGLKDSVLVNKTGLILSPRPTAEELSNAMIKLIKDNHLRLSLSRNALSWSNKFSWDKSYQVFKKVLGI